MRLPAAGLGLRRGLLDAIEALAPQAGAIGFLEAAPENWMGIGGTLGRRFRALTERWPLVAHGLSLSIGAPAPLDEDLVRRIGVFLEAHGIADYSEHLSYSGDDGHLYDLLPIPFTEDAVDYVARRVRRVQDILGRRIALENVSYYLHPPGSTMSELEFVNAVLERADCDLLLDVNNVYVNSVNQGYDARGFIDALPAARLRYLHVAGHAIESPGLIVDTHGAAVAEGVWQLLAYAYARLGPRPTLLERDFNLPPMSALQAEIARIHALGSAAPAHA